MTTRRRPAADHGRLKSLIVIGSVLATLIGGERLAHQPPAPAGPAPAVTLYQDAAAAGTQPDAPIVRLVIPEPVATSRSSR